MRLPRPLLVFPPPGRFVNRRDRVTPAQQDRIIRVVVEGTLRSASGDTD